MNQPVEASMLNVEAEEAILGCILLDPDAMNRIYETLELEAFALQVHRQIYQAAQKLYCNQQIVDLPGVTEYLTNHQLLEQVGGLSKLAQLLSRTVSAVNVDRYVEIVMEKYQRRRLITAGHEIVNLGYDTATQLEEVIDLAQQQVFAIAQKKQSQGLVDVSDSLFSAFQHFEDIVEGKVEPGLPTGFLDLDGQIAGGFGVSDLVILAARPAMGKCLSGDAELVRADGSIATIAEIYAQRESGPLLTLQDDWQFGWTSPSAFVDDGIKPVYRVTTRLGRRITTTLSHPYLTFTGWQPLSKLQVGEAIAVPRRLKVKGKTSYCPHRLKVLGYLLGDGCVTGTCLSLSTSRPEIKAEFAEAIAKGFVGLKTLEIYSKGKKAASIRISRCEEFLANQRKIWGEKLKQLLGDRQVGVRELAQELEVSRELIYQWLRGESVPNLETYNKLCQRFKISPEVLAPEGILTLRKSAPNGLALWLQELGLWGKAAAEKTIPSFVFTLQPKLLALFLSRLFTTDGSANISAQGRCEIGYCSMSEQLVRQIQHLLLRFGIISRVIHKTIEYKNELRSFWNLTFTDQKDLKTFIGEIGMFGQEERLQKIQNTIANRKYNPNRDLIPKAIWHQLAAAKGTEPWKHLAKRSGYSWIAPGRHGVPPEKLFNLATSLGDLKLQQLAASDVYWDEIVAIEALKPQQVYDLTIPETHNFVANDICVHNTSLALNMATNVAKQGKPVAIFSLEMDHQQLAQRLLAAEAKISSTRLRTGSIPEDKYEDLTEALHVLSGLPIKMDDTAGVTVNHVRTQVRRFEQQRNQELGLILIDYLQLMESSGGENRTQEVSRITRSLKNLARELRTPIVALSQLSRNVESRTNKRPMLSDLRESGSIEQDSDLVLMLYRDGYYYPDNPDQNVAELIVTKNRHGPVGTIKLLFQSEYTKFVNRAKMTQ